jgi:UDPglucose 6-dehydrogenase
MKIEKIVYTGNVYNIEVEPTHEINDDKFYINTDTGIIVHNCHPRDNIALRWLAEDLNLGYDLFHAIMDSRDNQAKNIAEKLKTLSIENSMTVVIHGRAYKPNVPYTLGSYSELVASYLICDGIPVSYVDPLTGDTNFPTNPCVWLMAHDPLTTYGGTEFGKTVEYKFYCDIPTGSIIVDPWRRIKRLDGSTIIHYGNPRFKQ